MHMQTKDPKVRELEETIQKYDRTVYGIALTQLKNKHEADDVFQEVFLLYFRKELKFDNEESKRAWLIRTTINKCRQFNFGKWNTGIDKSQELDDVYAIDLGAQEDNTVYEAVMELAPKYREIIYLHYFLGLSVNEIAHILKLRPNTVSVRSNRAKKLLKKRLEGDYI